MLNRSYAANNSTMSAIKFLFLLLIVCALSIPILAQSTTADRKELMNLLEQRKLKFDAYATSIQKHSGIFGNKTKKDMQQSNNVLTQIVETDNRIISVLNRTVDFRDFEKVNLNYDVQAHTDRVHALLHSVDTLQKQVQLLNSNKTYLSNKSERLQLELYAIITISICLFYFVLKQKKKQSTLQR